ncbi:MAG: hypothetical protein L0191_05760 [Acidobacteria bacterium]|nr:hypothetical protein [Acidobacteriota bacterium]
MMRAATRSCIVPPIGRWDTDKMVRVETNWWVQNRSAVVKKFDAWVLQ